MINLIPPAAKKKIVLEYWLRVCSVWFYIWTAAFLGGGVIMVPAYVLISSQVAVYESSASAAQEKLTSYETVSKDLVRASKQATALTDSFVVPSLSPYLKLFRSYESESLSLTSLTVGRGEEGIAPIKVTGTAANRQVLAAFRDALLKEPSVKGVDLPIANLAKDKDIPFTLTVTLVNNSNL